MSGVMTVPTSKPAGLPPDLHAYDLDDHGESWNSIFAAAAQEQSASNRGKHDDAASQPPPDPGGGAGDGPGPSAAMSGQTAPPHHRAGCAAVGGAAGIVIGGLIGGIGEGLAGAAAGTLAAPGVGTVGGAAVGAGDGVAAGAAVGGVIGAAAGAATCGGGRPVVHSMEGKGPSSGEATHAPAHKGKLTGSLDDLPTQAEKDYANEQLAAGHDVEIVPTGPTRTPDFKIDGRPVELKTISGVKNRTDDGLSKAVCDRILSGRGQSPNIVIDARKQPGMTKNAANRGLIRAIVRDSRTGDKLRNVTVLTPEGPVSFQK